MRILLVNKYLFPKGGAERAVFDLAEILREAGHEIAYVGMADARNTTGDAPTWTVRGEDYAAPHSFADSLRAGANILWNGSAYRTMLEAIDSFHPDIVHFHNIYHHLSPSVVIATKKRGIPSVMTLHDYKLLSPSRILFSPKRGIWTRPVPTLFELFRDPFTQGSRLRSFLCLVEYFLHHMTGAYRSISVFLSPSPFLKKLFEQHSFAGRIEFLPNPLPDVADRIDRAERDRRIPLPDASFIFVGRLDREKGITHLLEAFSILREEERLVIAGDGPDEDMFREQSERLELLASETVSFIGRKRPEEIDELLLRAKALIVPSLWYENQPYVVMEALSLGVPVIVPERGALPDMIDAGCGVVYRLGDAESLCEAIRNISRHSTDDHEKRRSSACERAKGYDSSTFCEKILSIYSKILNNKP